MQLTKNSFIDYKIINREQDNFNKQTIFITEIKYKEQKHTKTDKF